MDSIVAVHGGAGLHKINVDDICAKVLKQGKRNFIGVLKLLEDEKSTNCGTGSNLTIDGQVECEAAVCYSEGNAFGAIGSVKHIRNPIEVAALLAQDSITFETDLVKPSILVSDGAEKYAESKGISLCPNDDLITDRAKLHWQKAKLALRAEEYNRLDTVGAVSLNPNGHCSAACSSGGFIVKASGRLGLCTQVGGAIWAEQRQNRSVAVTLSGCGEYISRTLLAYKIASALFDWDSESGLFSECIRTTFMQSFYNSSLLTLRPKSRILAGGLVIVFDQGADIAELLAFHNTVHLPFAYDDGRKVTKLFSQKTNESDFIIAIIMENITFAKRFTIPTRDDDLLEDNDNFYTVDSKPTLEDVEGKIEDLRRQIAVGNWKCILEYFDYYFYCIRFEFDADPWEFRIPLVPLLTKGLSLVLDSVEKLLTVLVGVESEAFNNEGLTIERKMHLRAMQMYLYLLCRISQILETESQNRQRSASCVAPKKGGRKVQERNSDKDFVDNWAIERERVMVVLLKLTTMSFDGIDCQRRNGAIRFLWQPPIVCPNFLGLIKDFAFKLLENPELCKVSYRQWLYTIFEFLRTIAVYFDDYSKIGAKLVSLMKHLEYLATSSLNHSPFAEAIVAVCSNNDLDPLLLSMLTALGHLTSADFVRNDVSARPFALFITTLAEKKPEFLNKNAVLIAPFLSDDQPTLRCSVLTAFYEIVTVVYKGDLLVESARQTRDKLLLYLQDHIVDVNAVVRSRSLQLWARLARSSQIPLTFVQNCLIHDASCRLLDKSLFVRKNAAAFLSTFLDYNPFGSSLSSDELKLKLNHVYEEYREMKKQTPRNDLVKNAMKEWESIQETVLEYINAVVAKTKSEIMGTSMDHAENFRGGHEENYANSDALNTTVRAQQEEMMKKIMTGRWEDTVIPLMKDEATRHSVITAFVTAVIKDGFLITKTDGTNGEVAQKIFEIIGQGFLEKHVSEQLIDDEEVMLEQDKLEEFEAKISEIEKKIEHYQAALIFAFEMENCLELALRSVMTGQSNEIAESIKLIVEASKFEIKGSSEAIRGLFRVVWKRDNGVQEVLVNAAKDLFVSCNEKRDVAVRKTTENLFKVILGASEEERVSIEQVIYLMVQRDVFEAEIYDLIAEVLFSASGSLRVAALRLFSLICKAKKKFMQERFDIFVELANREGFFEGDNGSLAAEFCNLISMLGTLPNMKNLLTISQTPFRLDDSHQIFECIHNLLLHSFTVKEYCWIDVMMKGLNAIFYIDAQPSSRITRLVGDLVRISKFILSEAIKAKHLYNSFKEETACELKNSAETWLTDAQQLLEKEETWLKANAKVLNLLEDRNEKNGCDCINLQESELRVEILNELKKQVSFYTAGAVGCWDAVAERLCFFVGEIALKLLIHVDISFVAEMKRKNELLHCLRNGSMKDPVVAKLVETIKDFPDDRKFSDLEKDSVRGLGFFEATESENEDRLGLTGMSEEEKIVQGAQHICEKELLQDDALLGRLLPFVFHILEMKKCCGRERVRSAAALALANSDLCERAMPVFLNYLANSPSPVCRSNLIIAAGDICFRFPNIIEGCSEHIYNRIRDTDNYVRQTCIIVLTHLLLNDMIKVRTSIADLAKCVIDEDDHIADLANYLFAELSKKGNIVYNMMPDMISRLSADDDVTLDEFMRIMKTLLSFIKKDKHSDNLLEKLCLRLHTCIDQNGIVDERLAERVSFCISKLPLSERSSSVFTEHLPTIAHLFYIDVVYNNIHSAISCLRRTTIRNVDLKSELDDLLEELNKLRSEKADQKEIADRAFLQARKKAMKTPRKLLVKKRRSS